MLKSMYEELLGAERLFIGGFPNKLFEIVSKFEKRNDLTSDERINCIFLKLKYYIYYNNIDEFHRLAKQALKESRDSNNEFMIQYSLYSIALVYFRERDSERLLKSISELENLLKMAVKLSPTEMKFTKANIYYVKAEYHRLLGETNRAVEFLEEALALYIDVDEKYDIMEVLNLLGGIYLLKMELNEAKLYAEKCLSFQKTFRKRLWYWNYYLFGLIYSATGELDFSVEFFNEAIRLAKQEKHNYAINAARSMLGTIYLKQGDYNGSKKQLKECLTFGELHNIPSTIFVNTSNLFILTYEMESYEEAQQYLDRLEQIKKQGNTVMIDQTCRIYQAMMLKIGMGSRNRIKAEDILKQVFKEPINDLDNFELAFLHLADLYLIEYKLTENPELVKNLEILIEKTFTIATKQNMVGLIAETKLLSAKIALTNFNFKESQKLLSHAQQIAENHGLKWLARRISNEHDKLLNEQSTWEKLKFSDVTLSERLNLSGIGKELKNMIQKQIENLPMLEVEHTVCLIIYSKTGNCIFSYRIMDEPLFNDKQIGKIVTMSSQMGTESPERLKFGDFTVLLYRLDPLMLCYVFMGDSYAASQRLNNFSEALKENKAIINILKAAATTEQQININENPDLDELIKVCFTGDQQKLQLPFKAYKGDEPSLFVSYAHSDKLQVYPIMDYLNRSGFNVWYDEGISVSEDWMDSIVSSIEKCSAFLVFISPHIIDSKYVRKEISFALEIDKPFFAVYLKDTELPGRLKFEISGIQSMKKYTMPDGEFYAKIKEVLSPVLIGKK